MGREESPRGVALSCASRGWPIVPVTPGTTKPAVKRWDRVATTDGDKILRWWSGSYRTCGVAVVTDPRSGLVVLRVLRWEGGEAALMELLDVHGELPRSVRALNGAGVYELYFGVPTVPEGREIWSTFLGGHPGLDIQAKFGYVIVPPTEHPSGRKSEWVDGCAPWEVDVAPVPEWMFDLIYRRTDPPWLGRDDLRLKCLPEIEMQAILGVACSTSAPIEALWSSVRKGGRAT